MLGGRKRFLGLFKYPALSAESFIRPSRLWAHDAGPGWTGQPTNLWDRLERYWYKSPLAADANKSKRATEEEIRHFEQCNHIKLPDDLREYFLRLNGIEEDPDLFCFWPLSKLVPLSSSSSILAQKDRYFLFADYLIESSYYAIYLGDNPSLQNWVVLPDFSGSPVIAFSFSEFIEIYLIDSPKLYGNM